MKQQRPPIKLYSVTVKAMVSQIFVYNIEAHNNGEAEKIGKIICMRDEGYKEIQLSAKSFIIPHANKIHRL